MGFPDQKDIYPALKRPGSPPSWLCKIKEWEKEEKKHKKKKKKRKTKKNKR